MKHRLTRYGVLLWWGFAVLVSFETLAQDTSSRVRTFIVKTRAAPSQLSMMSASVRSVNSRYIANELRNNVRGVRSSVALPNTGYTVVKTDDPRSMLEALRANPFVDYVEENRTIWAPFDSLENEEELAHPDDFIYESFAYKYPDGQSPSDPSNGGSNNHPSSFTYSPWLRDILGFTQADQVRLDPTISYDEGNGGNPGTAPTHPSVKVAVIDTGANPNHPYLRPALSYNYHEIANNGIDEDDSLGRFPDDIWGWNSTNNSNDVTEISTDHGSHVAGIVKAVRDQAIAIENYSAAARKVEILPIRFINESGVGSTESAIKAIEYAQSRRAQVINASWGAGGVSSFSQALYDAFVQAYLDDIVIVVAAGNSLGSLQNNNDVIPYFPASFNIPSLLSVGSLTAEFVKSGSSSNLSYKGLSDFSNYGKNSVHLLAPGGYRDMSVNAGGDPNGIWSANAQVPSGSSMYIRKKGTSMAAPVVAGVAGVIRAIKPSLTSYEVVKVIEESITVVSNMGAVSRFGGHVNARAAFDLAAITTTQNLRPEVPAEPYSTYEAGQTSTIENSGNKKRSGGGCGAVTPIGMGSGGAGGGPFGGNSIFLFAAGYFLIALYRRLQSAFSI